MNEHSAIATTYTAIDRLSEPQDALIDIREVAKTFVKQRLDNTKSVEQIRAKALSKLSDRLDDEDAKFSPAALLNIIDTLNNSSKDDLATIMKAQSGDGKPGQGGNYYNIFMSGPDGSSGGFEGTTPQLNSKQFGIIEKLVLAAEVITTKNEGQ